MSGNIPAPILFEPGTELNQVLAGVALGAVAIWLLYSIGWLRRLVVAGIAGVLLVIFATRGVPGVVEIVARVMHFTLGDPALLRGMLLGKLLFGFVFTSSHHCRRRSNRSRASRQRYNNRSRNQRV